MSEVYNIYCDESCHLENDGQNVMVWGAVWCPEKVTRSISLDIKGIKEQFRLSKNIEFKWTKVSASKAEFYEALIEYFFKNQHLHFRGLIVPDKSKLNHSAFPGQTHEVFYYKMYFLLLQQILYPDARYRIYLDIKDTRGVAKQRQLHEYLCNKQRDFQREVVEKVQQIRSHESELLQLSDLIVGAVSYANRKLAGNAGKVRLVDQIKKRTNYNLSQSTLLQEMKFNLFCWQAKDICND